jgi:hypothetical protein
VRVASLDLAAERPNLPNARDDDVSLGAGLTFVDTAIGLVFGQSKMSRAAKGQGAAPLPPNLMLEEILIHCQREPTRR